MNRDTLKLLLPFTPHSLKNGLRLGRYSARTSPEVKREQSIMVAMIYQAVAHAGHRVTQGPLWPDDEISIEAVRHVLEDKFAITLRRLGPRPSGRTGRDRDTQNLLESFCDALQGVVLSNDNQIADARVRRVIEGEQ